MLRRFFIAALTLTLVLPAVAQADDKMVDKQLGKTFLFGGVNVRIDSIETASSKIDNPALKDMGDNNDAPGFVVIRVTMQNPTSGQDRVVPGINWGWEAADGTQRDMNGADQTYSGKSLVAVPDELHPKQTVQLTYVIGAYNNSALTKLFMKRNSGNEYSDTGAQYVRFDIKPADVKQLGA
jgi:hypothetical protein